MRPAEVLKSEYVGRANVSHFDMIQNTSTKEILLISKDGVIVPTGLFIPSKERSKIVSTELSEVSVCLTMSGNNVDLDEISEKLDISPTRTRSLDDWPDAIKNPVYELPEYLRPRFTWELNTGYSHCRLVRNKFDELLGCLEGKEYVINSLREQNDLEVSFTVGIHAQHDQCNLPELFLTNKIVTFAASTNADIGFDMYLD